MTASAQVFYPPPSSKKLADEEAAEREESNRWNKCCCCHVTKGVLVIGALELFFLMAEIGAIVATYILLEQGGEGAAGSSVNSTLSEDSDQSPPAAPQRPFGSSYKDYNWVYSQSPVATLSVGVGSGVIGISVVILMMAGVIKSKARLLIPHMVAQVIGVLALFAGVGLFIYASVTVSTSNTCSVTKQGDACTKVLLSFAAFIVVFAIVAGLQIYFFIITIRCYRYIKEKCKRYQNTPTPYYAIYQRQYQQQLQQLQQQQQQQQQAANQQQPVSAAAAAAYMQQQPIYATYAQPYGVPGYSYGYRYA